MPGWSTGETACVYEVDTLSEGGGGAKNKKNNSETTVVTYDPPVWSNKGTDFYISTSSAATWCTRQPWFTNSQLLDSKGAILNQAFLTII